MNRQLQTTLSAMTEIGLSEYSQRNIIMVMLFALRIQPEKYYHGNVVCSQNTAREILSW